METKTYSSNKERLKEELDKVLSEMKEQKSFEFLDTKVSFGKYKGQIYSDLMLRNPGYIKWMIEQNIFRHARHFKLYYRMMDLESDLENEK